METIELVVKMPRYAFDEIKKHDSVFSVYVSHVECMHDAVKNGTILPKGHGALKDTSKFLYECKLDYGCERICDCTNCVHHVIRERDVCNAPTIIDADKEGAEE